MIDWKETREGSGATPEGSALRVRLLGPWDVRLHGRPLRPLRSRKGEWLLALLVLHRGRAIARDWLAGTLWPDSPNAQALYNLRRNLSDLRRALGPEGGRLRAPTPHTLSLDLEGASVDVAQFDDLTAAGDGPSLEAAMRLYRGPLLPDCLEEWIVPERTEREQAYLGALESLARAARQRGDHQAAAHYLQLAVAVDPLLESAQAALMEALAARGDVPAAARVYHEFSRRLHREMNAGPAAETTALYERICAAAHAGLEAARPPAPGSPSAGDGGEADTRDAGPAALLPRIASAAPLSSLPQPVSSFVGRERELGEIVAALGAARLLTLTGPGGVGKSRLAIRVGERLALDFSHGVWFVELAGLATGADLPLVAQTVAQVLGVAEQPGRPLLETVREFLRPKRLLLILDNCEHLLAACSPLVASLLEGVPELRVLITSRQSLGLTGETDWRVPSLSVPGVGCWVLGVQTDPTPNTQHPTPNTLLQFESVRLFVERGRAAARCFALTPQNAAAVVDVCRRLDGLPLAIELAAARLKALTVEQIAQRLDDRFRLLTDGNRVALPRQQTLRATIDWSYDLLDEAERDLFRQLSVFAGGFTLEAAEAVCSATRNEGERVMGLLTQLVDKSLVMAEEAAVGSASDREAAGRLPLMPGIRGYPNAETRYRLLETVRSYTREKLQESGKAAAVRRRHEAFYLRLAEQAAPHQGGPDLAARLERVEAEVDNLRAALDSSLQSSPKRALRLAAALAGYWEGGRLAEGRQRLAAALGRAGAERRSRAGAAALEGASGLALLQEDRPAARALWEESLAIWRELGDRAGLAAVLAHQARLTFVRDDYPAARALYEESLAIHRERGDPTGVAAVLAGLGNIARRREEYEESRPLYEESLAIQRALGDRFGIAESLLGLGDTALGRGDTPAARAYYEEVLALRREMGDRSGIAHTLGELANVCRQQGDLAGAQRLREESLALWRVVGYKIAVIHSLGALGHLARERGDYAAARSSHAESLLLRQELGDPYTIAQSLEDFAELAADERQWARVTRLLGAAQALRDAVDKPLRPPERAGYDELLTAAGRALSEEAVAAAWQEGRAMIGPLPSAGQWEPAITYALER